ncbi:MAG TPA: NAD-dependent epimerase/dehydratase family protein [Xanthobacteraceae bacterium]|jgi:UDP-glucose 4-epimerase
MSKGLVVALTGATGFIGRHLLRALPQRGYELRVLLRSPTVLPTASRSAVIGDLARPLNLAAALEGAGAVIHSAGPPATMSGLPEEDHRNLSTDATVMLARAAQRAGVRRFVFMSSIAAQCGPYADEALTEDFEPRPTGAYGLAKLGAERGLAELEIDWVALRAVLVYGPGMKGNMARLLRIARSPVPLPFAGLAARRSLLSLDNLADAIDTVLAAPAKLRRALIVADSEALTVAQMIAAMRRGLGRGPGLFPLPVSLLKAALRAAGRDQELQLLTEPLVASAAALRGLGWAPSVSTPAGLAALAKSEQSGHAPTMGGGESI